MKIRILPLVVVAASMLLFACNSSVSIAKKRYSNGYYVSVSKNENTSLKSEEQVAPANEVVKVSTSKTSTKTSSAELIESAKAVDAKAKVKEIVVSSKEENKALVTTKGTKQEENKILEVITKKEKSAASTPDDMSDEFLLVLVLTILIPPLGVYWFKKEARPTLIDILLILLGAVVSFALGGFFGYGLGWLLAVIYGLFYIFEKL